MGALGTNGLKDYLRNHKQKMKVNKETSETKDKSKQNV